MRLSKTHLNELTYEVIGAAIEVHKALGPGLLEKSYQKCLSHELSLRKIPFITELEMAVDYKGENIILDMRCDLFIDNSIVVELKSVANVLSVHEAQLLGYMKLLKAPKGILINFNVVNLYNEGQKTYVNELYRNLPA